jgi:hypothetical protein
MKFAIFSLVLLPQLVMAYHSGTNKNYPVKESTYSEDNRSPAAISLKNKLFKKK